MTKNSDVLKYNDLYYYCNNHRTTKLSEKLDNKGNKLRISICNSKIKYERDIDKYIFCEDHSEECDNLERAKITNIIEVKTGINNYENFTEALKEYLNKFPMITFHEFKVYAQNLYNEKNLELELNNSYYSNLYYNWRKKSRVFTKYSLFDNQFTDNGKQYMRDYTLTMLYNKNNKSQFQNEHVIYISDYFIKKLSFSTHFYIDGTFIFPKDFKQLIVILYYDDLLKKRFPGMYALINNKKEEGYYILFKKIYEIITLEGTRELKLQTYTTDFETGLINALERVFINKRKIGCFFHYTRALKSKALEMKLFSTGLKELTKEFLHELYKAPFLIIKDKNFINSICEKYMEKEGRFKEYIYYYKTQWTRFFNNGMLNYSDLSKYERSNSYIENYNRRIKLKLSKFLYGKNRCKISWPLFIYFIKNEERENQIEYHELENKLEEKGKLNENKNSLPEIKKKKGKI